MTTATKEAESKAEMTVEEAVLDAALARCLPDAQIKKALRSIPNGHDAMFDFTARVRGALRKGHAGEMAASGRDLWNKSAMAKLLVKLGVKADDVEPAVRKALTQAMRDAESGAARSAREHLVMTILEQVEQAMIAAMPKRERAGSVRVTAKVEIVEA